MEKIFKREDYENMGSPVNLVIPEGFMEIDREAFSGCTSLRDIVIHDSVTEI